MSNKIASYFRSVFVLLGAGFLFFGCVPLEPVEQGGGREDRVALMKDSHDHGCSYFYFLWGRHAELAAKHREALEAYEKALICDPAADYIVRKIPLLLMRLNRDNEAIAKLDAYLIKHPQETDSRMVLAKIYIRQGKLEHAAGQYLKIHQNNPDNTSVLLLLSELYLARGEHLLSRDSLQEILKIDSESYSAHLLLARIYIVEENFSSGYHHYQQALSINWSSELLLELADVYIQQKKFKRAVKQYQIILEREELNEDARIGLIHVYLLQKKDKKVLAELDRLKGVSNNPEQVDLTIVRLFVRWDQFDKAIALLEDILAKNDLAEARYLLAILHYRAEKYEQAMEVLRGISSDAHEYEDGVFMMVRIMRELNRYKEAMQLLESIISMEVERNPDLYVLLATMYQFDGQKERARATYKRGLDSHPDNPDLLYEYGQFQEYFGEQDQALETMQEVIRQQPEHAGALNYVGYTWAVRKINLNKAFIYISRAVDLKPENGYIRDSLDWVYFQQGKLDEALKTLEHALQLSSGDPAIIDHLSDAYQAKGRLVEALEGYRKALVLYDEAAAEGKENGQPEVEKERNNRERSLLTEKIRHLEAEGVE